MKFVLSILVVISFCIPVHAVTIIDGDYNIFSGSLEDTIVNGQLRVRGSDVTLTNVQAHSLFQTRGNTGLRVYDSEFISPDPGAGTGIVLQPDSIVENTRVIGHKDGIYFETGGPGVLRNVEVDIRSDLPDNHADGITLPFTQNYNGNAGFVVDESIIWAEGKTAAFNQQGIPISVSNSVWSGFAYTNPGSVFLNSFAANPNDVRYLGDVVPWEVPWETFYANVQWDVRPLSEIPEPSGLVLLVIGCLFLYMRHHKQTV